MWPKLFRRQECGFMYTTQATFRTRVFPSRHPRAPHFASPSPKPSIAACRQKLSPPRQLRAMASKPTQATLLATTSPGQYSHDRTPKAPLTPLQGREIPPRLPGRHSRQHRDRRASQDHRQRWQHAALHHIRHARHRQDDLHPLSGSPAPRRRLQGGRPGTQRQ